MVSVAPSEHDRRVARRAAHARRGARSAPCSTGAATTLARSLLEPLTRRQRERLVGAMREVERLLTAALVEIVAGDPAHPDARHCLRSYFAELDRRRTPASTRGRQHRRAARAAPARRLLLVAYLRGEPIGCGALKLHGARRTEIKRMWVADAARGLGVGRRLLDELSTAPAATARDGPARDEPDAHRGDRALPLRRLREVPAFNDEPFAHHWFEKRCRKGDPLGDGGGLATPSPKAGMARLPHGHLRCRGSQTSPSDTARATPPSTPSPRHPRDRARQFTAIMGPSGSGKSTLMHCSRGSTSPPGTVDIGGDRAQAARRQPSRLRRDQSASSSRRSTSFRLTAEENIRLPLTLAGREPDREWLDIVIDTVGLGDRLGHRPARAVRRPAAARRRGAGAHLRARSGLRRRADRQPRLGARRGDPGLLRQRGRRARPDRRDGHARRGRRVVRRPRDLPRRRGDRGRRLGPRRRADPRSDEGPGGDPFSRCAGSRRASCAPR